MNAGRLVAVQLAPLFVLYDGTASGGAQTRLLRDVTAMLCTWLWLAAAPVGRDANWFQLLPASPDQNAMTVWPFLLSTPEAAM